MENITVEHIAHYFIACVDPEKEDEVTNLRLQKLLFYAQAYYLAKFDRPLFNDDFSAWQYGPVQEEIYHKYKKYGRSGIDIHDAELQNQLHKDIVDFLDDIWAYFGRFTAGFLVELTHSEDPWVNTYNAGEDIIKKESIKKFYKTKISEVFL